MQTTLNNMTDAFDLIISKKGYNWDNSDIRNIDFHSSMALPQEKTVLTGYLDFAPGDTKKSLTLPHGLNFTPWYFPYFRNNDLGQEMMLPIFPTGIEGIGFPSITSRVNGTNVVFDVDFGIGWNVYRLYFSHLWNTYNDSTGFFEVGREGGSSYHGAVRIPSVPVTSSESLESAKLYYVVTGRAGTPNVDVIRFRIWGIDEDNTQTFNNPMSRPKTDAMTYQTRTVPNQLGDTVEMDVISQLNEIRSRGGWSSGNAMGFLVEDYNSDNDAAFWSASEGGDGVWMELKKSGTLRLYFKAVVLTEKII